MKSRLVIILFILVSGYIITNTSKDWTWWVYKWDKSGYHLYLPAVFIYKDVKKLEFYAHVDEVNQPSGSHKNYGLIPLDNGNRVNKYNVGLAVHETPFFLAAHFINTTWLPYQADGYSQPYEWATIISNLFFTVIGLLAIRRLLRKYFNDGIVAFTLLTIAFGTNLYYYVTFSAGGTHCYSFFHLALLVLYTEQLYGSKNKKYFYYIAIVLGLISITRPANMLAAIIPLLWGINSLEAIKERIIFLKTNLLAILSAIPLFTAILMLQLGYWKFVTGSWYFDGYVDEGFIWTEPRIWQGLFGFQKGWFIYAPISIFAIWGIYSMRKQFSKLIPVISMFLIVYIYVTFSWWNWWYGGCFGSRPMVDATAVLALPFAAFIHSVSTHRFKLVTVFIALIFTLLIALNMFKSYQYYKVVLHWERMSKAHYFKTFFNTKPSGEYDQYLMSEQEFYDETAHRINQLNKK